MMERRQQKNQFLQEKIEIAFIDAMVKTNRVNDRLNDKKECYERFFVFE